MNTPLLSSSIVFGLAIAAGCGNSVETASGGSGGGSTTSSTTSTTSTSTGTGGQCPGYEDQAGTGKVTLHFINKTTQPIYLNASCSGAGFDYTLSPVGGSEGVFYHYETSCLQTCAELQKETPIDCAPCAPSVVRLDPGAVRELEWDGTGMQVDVAMPASCYAAGGGASDTCQRIVAATPGMYQVLAQGSAECGPSCTCDANGVCQGYPEGASAAATPTVFGFPGTTSVDVVFDVCAFGCPNP